MMLCYFAKHDIFSLLLKLKNTFIKLYGAVFIIKAIQITTGRIMNLQINLFITNCADTYYLPSFNKYHKLFKQ